MRSTWSRAGVMTVPLDRYGGEAVVFRHPT